MKILGAKTMQSKNSDKMGEDAKPGVHNFFSRETCTKTRDATLFEIALRRETQKLFRDACPALHLAPSYVLYKHSIPVSHADTTVWLKLATPTGLNNFCSRNSLHKETPPYI